MHAYEHASVHDVILLFSITFSNLVQSGPISS